MLKIFKIVSQTIFGLVEVRKMSLYGHTMIDLESLKRWVNSLEVKENSEVDIAGFKMKVENSNKQLLELQLQGFSNAINQMKEGDDWREYQGILSQLFYNTFVRLDNSSIKMGDFYECLIRPSNIKTYKKIIKGFDYQNIGAINIKDENEKPVASIGYKSDLIWAVFFEYFVNENEDGSFDHVYGSHENILSIQLYDVENYSAGELKARVNEILLHVSMKYDMDFGVFELDSRFKEEGSDTIISDEYTPIGLEEIPMYYLTSAISASDERNKFLSFYQVIEYFFIRAQNYYILNELTNINISSVNHNELSKILAEHKKISVERESLKLVLKKALNMQNFKSWINSKTEYVETYINCAEDSIDITKSDDKIISRIAERVYKYRCSIAHAKGDIEEYIAIPSVCKETISAEIPLLKYLAYEVIKQWSE